MFGLPTKIRAGLTFDEVLLEPRKTDVLRQDTSVKTYLTKATTLDIPVLAAASDTVSEARLAIALGALGGMAVLHRNCTVNEQSVMVREVKQKLELVGAAVGPTDVARALALVDAGATHIFIDCAHAHAPGIIDAVREMKRKTKAQVIAGNIATKEAAKDYAPFADALKVGIGPGSICTTRVVSGVGVPQLTAIMDVASVAKKYSIPLIADGGIRFSGDVVKAFAAGASLVMLGSLLAGTDEAPGEVSEENGKQYKSYRGMGSAAAIEKRHAVDKYAPGMNTMTAEGVSGRVPLKGPVSDVVGQIVSGVQAGMGYLGARTIADLPRQARFIYISKAGLLESHPHSIIQDTLTK